LGTKADGLQTKANDPFDFIANFHWDEAKTAMDNYVDYVNGLNSRVGNAPGTGMGVWAMPQDPSQHAAGSTGLPDGTFTVGEQGFELMSKHGSNVQVLSNPQSRHTIAASNSGGGPTINVTVNGSILSERDLSAALDRAMKRGNKMAWT